MNENPAQKRKKKPGAPRPPRKVSESWLHNAGLYYLQRFAASKAHFRTVMIRKITRSCTYHNDPHLEKYEKWLDDLIIRFEELELLNDDAYARAMVNSLRRRGLSGRAIHAKLQSKGLDADDIKKALNRHDEEESLDSDLLAALRTARRKRLGPFQKAVRSAELPAEDIQNDDIAQKRRKALGAMARAGFSYDIAERVLTMTAEDAQELLDTYNL